MMKHALLLLLCFPWLALGYPLTPNDKMTPGERCNDEDADFSEYRYAEEIPYCARNVSGGTKKTVYESYGVGESERKQYTIDHLIPLSLGGSNHRVNLWPEHKEVKALRPTLEMELYVSLKDGALNQEQAIEKILDAKFHPCDSPQQDFHPLEESYNACSRPREIASNHVITY